MRPPPERFNIARYCLAGRAAAHPDKTALIIVGGEGKERAWSYRELDLAVRRLAGGLRHMGLAAGERLMIRMDNDLGYVLSFFAALAAGLVALPSSAALTGKEAEFLLEDSAAAALALADGLALAHQPAPGVRVLDTALIEALARDAEPIDYADTAAEDPAFLIYTPALSASQRACCTATAVPGAAGRCIAAGTVSAPATSSSTPAPSTGPTLWASA